MSTNYVESSLKRFLKRKVKVTLGLVVAFLITGTVGFAEENPDAQKELKEILDTIKTTNETFKGFETFKLDSDKVKKEIGDDFTISSTKNGDINTISIKDTTANYEKTIELSDKYLTSKIKNIVENIIPNLNDKQTNPVTENINSTTLIIASQNIQNATAENNKDNPLTNEGMIITSANAQSSSVENTALKNNGIILASNYGQVIQKGSSKAVNDGVVISNYGQVIFGDKATVENNGLFLVTGGGQYVNGKKDSTLSNTGVIIKTGTNEAAQYAIGIKEGKTNIYNYGLIESKAHGQYFSAEEMSSCTGNIKNYGIIKTSGTGQYVSRNSTAYNYGLIEIPNNLAISAINGAKGYNYGVVKAESGNIFNGDVTNKGVVISDSKTNYSQNQWYKTGVYLDSKYNLKNSEYVQQFENGIVKDDSFTETAEDGNIKSVAYVKDSSVQIDNINGKTISAVVTKDSNLDGAVFTYAGADERGLLLNDNALVGYFEKEGTLLDLGNKSLTLTGDSVISAVKSDMDIDVTAVKVGDGGSLTLSGNSEVNGIIEGVETSEIKFENYKKVFSLNNGGLTEIKNSDDEEINKGYANYTNTTFAEGNTNGLQLDFTKTSEGMTNKITINSGVVINKADGQEWAVNDLTETENVKTEMTIKDINNSIKGDILLGEGENILIVDNAKRTETIDGNEVLKKSFEHKIDLGTGDKDKFIVKYSTAAEETYKESGYNIFNFDVTNAETIELSGAGEWTIGTEANINFDNNNKGDEVTLKAANGATLNIIMQEGGSNLNKLIKEGGLLDSGNRLVLGTDNISLIKYQIGGTGLPFTAEDTSYTADYGIAEDANVVAPIFNVSSDGKTTSISLKTAEQAGVGNYAPIYNAYVNQVAEKNWDVIEYINSLNSDKDFADRIVKTDLNAKAYYTAGTVVTKNITDSYLSAVEEFGKRAQKGEWIAQGKFINSDTEFDGGSKVKGYDGDINSAVAMVEYGVTENTSYGVAFGGGDTEIDIDGGGKLDGDNYYLGAYVKHRTQNGIDLVGNFGIMKSDLDSKLGSEFGFTVNGVDMSGTTFEEGTADSTAFALSLKGTKDFYVADTVKLQPVLGARMTLINQDKAENPAMNFEIKEQDVFVAEGILGVNAVKEFALEKGIFELNTGVEYSLAASTENDDAEYRLFNNDDIKIENGEIASSKGTFHFGADYEHENGVGFNAKYEMMWSDEGDDSRITAGISYRF